MAESETPALSVESTPNGPKHIKDKKCPWCGTPFTSSSLGRHLDLYIRPNNPKQPDGIHDVTAIRRLRGTITRRKTKGTSRRRHGSASAAGSETPGAPSKDGISPAPSDIVQSPAPTTAQRSRGSVSAAFGRNHPFNTPWEVTGVIDFSQRSNGVASHPEERQALPDGPRSQALVPPPQPPHTSSFGQQPLHHQPDPRQLIQDAQDTARAAELALREMVCSWRAAK